MTGHKKIATLGCAGIGAAALLFGLYHFYSAIQFVLAKSAETANGAYYSQGSMESNIGMHQASDSPLYIFLNHNFSNTGLSCDEVFDSMTAQLAPYAYQFPAFNVTETPYSPSDFTGIAADGNAKGAFEKVCAKDPDSNFYKDLILLAKADYATCKGECDWIFCRSSTLKQDTPGGLLWNCDFQYSIQTTYPISGVAGKNIEQTKKTWENLWNSMECDPDYHVYCGENDEAAGAQWQSARIPLYAGSALLLAAVLLCCFMPADVEQGEAGAELMS